MKPIGAIILAGWLASACSARAQSRLHEFEGTWIREPDESVLPATPPGWAHLVSETMSVARNDGSFYKARFEQAFSDGSSQSFDDAFAEDGADHAAGPDTRQFMVRISVLADGGRHVVSGAPGEKHESFCHVLPSGRTLTCSGTHRAAGGTTSTFLCVYHRDDHAWPVALVMRPHDARRAG